MGEAHRAWNRTGRDADEPAASSGGGAQTELEGGLLLGVSGSWAARIDGWWPCEASQGVSVARNQAGGKNS